MHFRRGTIAGKSRAEKNKERTACAKVLRWETLRCVQGTGIRYILQVDLAGRRVGLDAEVRQRDVVKVT